MARRGKRPASRANGLRELRIAAGLSQSQLAIEAGVSVKTVSRIEKGSAVAPRTRFRVLIGYNSIQQRNGMKATDYAGMFPNDPRE